MNARSADHESRERVKGGCTAYNKRRRVRWKWRWRRKSGVPNWRMSGFFNSLKNFASGAAYAASSASKYEELEGEQSYLQHAMHRTTCACPRSPANGISTIRFIVYRPCCMRISILTFVALWLLRFSESSPPPPFVSIPLFFFFFFASMTMNGWTGRDSNSKKWSNREFILILGLSMIKWIFFSES